MIDSFKDVLNLDILAYLLRDVDVGKGWGPCPVPTGGLGVCGCFGGGESATMAYPNLNF